MCESSTDLSTLSATTVGSTFQHVTVLRNIRWIVWLDAARAALERKAAHRKIDGANKGPTTPGVYHMIELSMLKNLGIDPKIKIIRIS